MAAALRPIARRPTLAVELAVALAWVALLVAPAGGRGAAGGGISGGALFVCSLSGAGAGGAASGAGGVAAATSSQTAALVSALPLLALMAAAMMLPTAIPAVRHVAVRSLYWRRRRATLEFVAVYVALWAAFAVVAFGLLAPRLPTGAALALPLALALAAAWQLTPLKLRALRACHRPTALPVRGWRATAGVARFGLRNGVACLASCWALMLTMAAAGSIGLLWMAGLTGLIAAEKFSLRPIRASRRVAALLAVAALTAATPAVLGAA